MLDLEKEGWSNNFPVQDPDWLYDEGRGISDLTQEEWDFIPVLLRNQSLWRKLANSRMKPIDLRYEHYFDVYTKLQVNPPHYKWMEIFTFQYVLPAMFLMLLVVILPDTFLSLDFFKEITIAFGLTAERERTHGIVFFYYLIYFMMTIFISIQHVKKIGFMTRFVKFSHFFYFYRFRVLLLFLTFIYLMNPPLDPLGSSSLWFSDNVEAEPTILVAKMLALTGVTSMLLIAWIVFPERLIEKSYMGVITRNIFYKSEIIKKVKNHAK